MLARYHENKKELNKKRHELDRKKLKEDPQYALKRRLRNRISCAARRWLTGKAKAGSAVRDLGCSLNDLVTYLEEQFQLGMSWENYGRDGWHIDHKIPLSLFDLTDRDQFARAVNYTNLQPKWQTDNLTKGNRLEPPSLW